MSTVANYGNVLKEIQIMQSDIDVICDYINKMPEDGLMVEWGSGGSTCKWLETLTLNQKLITIEHNEDWYNRVARAIKNEWGDVSNKFKFYHIPEKFIQHGYGNIGEEHPCGTDEYINPPDDSIWDADIFYVDGIARATCLFSILLRKKKSNPVIMIHDYVGREEWYSWAVQYFNVQIFNQTDERSTLAALTPK
jgi:hypothetical protein